MSKTRHDATARRYVPPKHAAQILGVSTTTLRKWALKGTIAAIRLPNGRFHYDVDGLMETMAIVPGEKPTEVVKPIAKAPTAPQSVVVEAEPPVAREAVPADAKPKASEAKPKSNGRQAKAQPEQIPVVPTVPNLSPQQLMEMIQKLAGANPNGMGG